MDKIAKGYWSLPEPELTLECVHCEHFVMDAEELMPMERYKGVIKCDQCGKFLKVDIEVY
jgi:NAD-dependent SIR2 family protein deacetylase